MFVIDTTVHRPLVFILGPVRRHLRMAHRASPGVILQITRRNNRRTFQTA